MNDSIFARTLALHIFADANISHPHLKRRAVPSQNLPVRSVYKKLSSPQKEKLKLRAERAERRRRVVLENVLHQEELPEIVPNEFAELEAATALLQLQYTK